MKKIYYPFILLIILPGTLLAQWSQFPAFAGEERDGAFSFAINGVLYVGGGILSTDMWKFDAATQQWKDSGTIADGNPRCFAAAFVHNNKGYLIGGDRSFGDATNEVWCYDPAGAGWTKKNNFPGGIRVGMVTWTIDNRVFAGGGCEEFSSNGFVNTSNSFYEYLPASDTWVQLGNLPHPSAFASGFTIGANLYLVFGSEDNSSYKNALYMYDTASKQWTAKAVFPGTRRNSGIAFAISGKGYAGMGQDDLLTTYSDFYEYTPGTDSWTKLTDYPDTKTGWSTACVMNNVAYIGTGAELPSLDFTKSMFRFSPGTTGMNEITNTSLTSVYPNPFTSVVHIDGLTDTETTVIITGITGNEVGQYKISSLQPEIHLDELPTGVYFLQLNSFTHKIIKQ